MTLEPGIGGRCDARLERVGALIDQNLCDQRDLGFSMYVDLGGEALLDLWGGFRDAERTKPWQRDTIVNVWSITKMVTNMAALMLADCGEIGLDEPVARYWPAFARNGKGDVLVRHVLSHTAGIPAWEQPIELEDLYDWDRSVALLAAQPLWWQPGTGSGYHTLTQGHIVGEIVRRVTGIPLKGFVAEQIAKPLEVDFQIGAAERDWERIAPVQPSPPAPYDPMQLPRDDIERRAYCGPPLDDAAVNTEPWREATIPAANGHGNAAAIAQIMSIITRGGEARGVQLLSEETIERIFEPQSAGVDLVMKVPVRFGIGYALPEPASAPDIPEGKICFWGGRGGSLALMDLDRGLTVVYVMNQMAQDQGQPSLVGNEVATGYLREIYRCLG